MTPQLEQLKQRLQRFADKPNEYHAIAGHDCRLILSELEGRECKGSVYDILYGKDCTYDHSKLQLYGDPCPVCGIVQGSDMK